MRDPRRRNKACLEAAEVGRLEDGGNGVAVLVNSNRYVACQCSNSRKSQERAEQKERRPGIDEPPL